MITSVPEMRKAASVGLIGACVGRDFKMALFTNPHKSAYLWRVGTVSLMSPAPSRLDITMPVDDKATFLTLDRDINKSFDLPAVLAQPYIVIDFFRELYAPLVLRDGRMITNGMEVQKYGAEKLGLDVADRIEAHNPRFPALWIESFRRFCAVANQSGAQFLIVPIYQLTTFWHDGPFEIEPTWQPKQILARNLILGFMQRIALALLHNALLVPLLPETLALDPAHEYGRGPYHFHRSAFQRAVEVMDQLPELITQITPTDARREAMVEAELAAWARTIASSRHFA